MTAEDEVKAREPEAVALRGKHQWSIYVFDRGNGYQPRRLGRGASIVAAWECAAKRIRTVLQ